MIGRSCFSRPSYGITRPSCRTQRIYNLDSLLRYPEGAQAIRRFSLSSILREPPKPINHYEVLRLPPTATKAELKRQFYALSKETHPDRHPDDPTAAEKFSQLSESYSILGNEEKRRRYDRDFFRQQQVAAGRSRASGSYAGSRPASGLSKRRGTFRGPPPSFYAQGSYGSSGRTANTGESSSSSSTSSSRPEPNLNGTFNSSAFTDRANTDFNPEPTFRTQSAEDIRRMQRRANEARAMQAELDAMNDSDFWGRFVVVSAIVALGVTVGTLIVNMSNTPRGGLTRADGSKRGDRDNAWAKG